MMTPSDETEFAPPPNPLSDLRQLTLGESLRRASLHTAIGGQRQGGISTPARLPVVLLFTGATGSQHGYNDGWSDNVFCYFGEGQVGDMTWVRGNVAIRDHAINGRDLYLFKILSEPRSHVQFVGTFNAASWEYRLTSDRKQQPRRAIVFHLVPVDLAAPEEASQPPSTDDLPSLRKAAYNAGANAPSLTIKQSLQSYISRSHAVRAYALGRADARCEACSMTAPFLTASGLPYLEVHHINRLADGGPDIPNMVAAICPNCHRAAHFGRDAAALNARLLAIIKHKEEAASDGI